VQRDAATTGLSARLDMEDGIAKPRLLIAITPRVRE
jgi:hypothetical protein